MGQVMNLEGPWKTDRVKRGLRTIEIEPGDTVIVGTQVLRVIRRLGSGKLLVRNAMEFRFAQPPPDLMAEVMGE